MNGSENVAAVRTCLWFDGNAEEAARFYVSLLAGSGIDRVDRPAPGDPAVLVTFHLAGTPFVALNGGPGVEHSPAASIAVELPQDAADRLYDALLEAGGTEARCGWITDRFGISWQVMPEGLHEALFGSDAAANARAYEALLQMTRLDTARLAAARENR